MVVCHRLTQAGAPLGFQVTFFRSRLQFGQANPSRFAPRQLLFANVALSDPVAGKLQHDQRAARSGFGLAFADTADTDVYIDNWSLRRERTGRYRARIPAIRCPLRHLPTPEAGIGRGPAPLPQVM